MFQNVESKEIKRPLESKYKEYTILKFKSSKTAKRFFNKWMKDKNLGWISSYDNKIIYFKPREFTKIKFKKRDLYHVQSLSTRI